jgi:hypothetical protein
MTNTIDRIINELVTGKKISAALSAVYTKRNIALVCSDKWMDMDVRQLDGVNVRIINSLMRAHLCTVGDIVKYIEDGNKLSDVRSMGADSCGKIMEIILDYAWSRMSVEEKAAFLLDTATRNERYLRA